MDRIRLKDKEFELYIPEEEVKAAIKRVAMEIEKDIQGKDPLFVGILNGAFRFIADIMYYLNGPYELTFARYASYHGTESSGILQEIMPVKSDIKGRSIIILEDIIDTGFTMMKIIEKLKQDGAAEVKLATMLFKPDALKYDVKPDYVGLEISNDFIVGCGLDYEELGRSYRNIYRVVEN